VTTRRTQGGGTVKARKHRRKGRLAFALVAGLAATAIAAPAAPAAPPPFPPSCQGLTPEFPFLPWGDAAPYLLVPGGSFESAPPWVLKGGAAVTAENESFFVHGPTDSHSLKLPPGSSAKSPQICVGLARPTLRLFTKNPGVSSATLKVELLFKSNPNGQNSTLTLGNLTAASGWQPTNVIPLQGSLQPIRRSVYSPVSFKFTAQGRNGKWQIDDVYVDPWRH
jgi:hypothetical protein